MAIKCNNCGFVHEQNALPSKCRRCGNTDLTQFERVPSTIDPKKHAEEKASLEEL